MQTIEKLTIVGVGLIGGSIGLAARRAGLAREIVGVGRRPASLDKAVAAGAVDRGTTDLTEGVAGADICVVCTPVETIAGIVEQAVRHYPAALYTDAGSTKAEIVAHLETSLPAEARFVGSHPMAGSDESGPEFARESLFDRRAVVVTPTPRSRTEDVAAVRQFWFAIGADVIDMLPDEHDRAVAATSHLPHLLAAAIAQATPDEYAAVIGTGWLDTTRVAGGDATLWRQIVMTNHENVLASLDQTQQVIDALRDALARGDGETIERLLTEAKRKRNALGS